MIRVGRESVWFCSKGMRCDTFVLVIDLDRRAIVKEVHLLPYQRDRNAVVVFIKTDIAVLLDCGDASFLNLEADGIQWSHAGTFDFLVLLATTIVPAGHICVIMNLKSDPDGGVKPL